ncbi:hypothetical protein RFI_00506 [Reticulomyxa filosa]|uniref:Uncharacterized protein n=1 Tax=Reticulomyxa filosa TaxID=46433 RepID=X6PDI5_RETFI|nr:hypothetical protein RFI_00506 [Reticulomyxa filosa]|eukprot:ETO36555.1 hypothetical protein RFI_00506 [Reticulomyxa filosa]
MIHFYKFYVIIEKENKKKEIQQTLTTDVYKKSVNCIILIELMESLVDAGPSDVIKNVLPTVKKSNLNSNEHNQKYQFFLKKKTKCIFLFIVNYCCTICKKNVFFKNHFIKARQTLVHIFAFV